MKRIKKMMICLLAVITIASCFSLFASAQTIGIYHQNIERVAKLQTYNGADGPGGLAITNDNKMFAIKAGTNDTTATLFYFPNAAASNLNSTRSIFSINDVGHANAMTTDNTNIYITGWVNVNAGGTLQSGNTYNNWIVKVPISVIVNAAQNSLTAIPKKTATTNGYSIIYPYTQTGNNQYTPYTHIINMLTFFQQTSTSTNTYIINYSNLDGSNDYWFTKAHIATDNQGNEILVVSQSTSDIFVVKKTMSLDDPVSQDICATFNNGFFICQYNVNEAGLGNQNTPEEEKTSTKNVIEWTNIKVATNHHKTVNNVSYDYYDEHDKININNDEKFTDTDGIEKKVFKSFEVESIGFITGSDYTSQMVCSCDVIFTQEYEDYARAHSLSLAADGIFKATNSIGTFLV